MNQNGTNAVQFYVSASASGCGGEGAAQWNGVMTQNVWQQMVVTFDGTLGTGSKAQLYINGVLQTKSSDSLSLAATGSFTTDPLTVGTLDGISPKWPFDGYLEEARIYNRILTQAEINTLALSRSRVNITEGLIFYEPLDDGKVGTVTNNATLFDRSGYGNTGTVTNSPTWIQGVLNYQ